MKQIGTSIEPINTIHSSVEKSLHWHVMMMILFNAKVEIFTPSHAVIPSFIAQCFTTSVHYFLFLNMLASLFGFLLQVHKKLGFSTRIGTRDKYNQTFATQIASVSDHNSVCSDIMS